MCPISTKKRELNKIRVGSAKNPMRRSGRILIHQGSVSFRIYLMLCHEDKTQECGDQGKGSGVLNSSHILFVFLGSRELLGPSAH
jgi:hypothetical protein